MLLLEHAREVGHVVEAAKLSHLTDRHFHILFKQMLGLAHAHLIHIRHRVQAGDGKHFPTQLRCAHAHLEGDVVNVDVALRSQLYLAVHYVDEVVQKLSVTAGERLIGIVIAVGVVLGKDGTKNSTLLEQFADAHTQLLAVEWLEKEKLLTEIRDLLKQK